MANSLQWPFSLREVSLENECDLIDQDGGYSLFYGVFWIWLLLTCALVVTGVIEWRNRGDEGGYKGNDGRDEES